MENNKQTAVEWFYQMILPKDTQAVFLLAKDIEVLFEQAKVMEKEQKLQSYNQGYRDGELDERNPFPLHRKNR